MITGEHRLTLLKELLHEANKDLVALDVQEKIFQASALDPRAAEGVRTGLQVIASQRNLTEKKLQLYAQEIDQLTKTS